jgi:hypothetical protein
MRGRTKLVTLGAILAVTLAVSMVFASGVMDVSKMSLFSGPIMEPDSPGDPHIFFDPAKRSGDYVNTPGFAIGQTVYFSVNISDVTDLYAYQINVTWTPGILNFTGIESYGDLMLKGSPPAGTSRIENIAFASNESGYAVIAETILGDVGGVTDLVGGRAFSMSFEIVGYGWTELNIGLSGYLKTTLLDSGGAEISVFTDTVGWFDNRIRGDSNGDKFVTLADVAIVSARWTSPPGSLPYARWCDWDDNGFITLGDWAIVSANWGRYVP